MIDVSWRLIGGSWLMFFDWWLPIDHYWFTIDDFWLMIADAWCQMMSIRRNPIQFMHDWTFFWDLGLIPEKPSENPKKGIYIYTVCLECLPIFIYNIGFGKNNKITKLVKKKTFKHATLPASVTTVPLLVVSWNCIVLQVLASEEEEVTTSTRNLYIFRNHLWIYDYSPFIVIQR